MTDLPLLDDLAQAAAHAPPPPDMPVSAIPMLLPLQWEMGRLTTQDGQQFNAITFHQPNQKCHVVMNDDDAKKLADALLSQVTGITIARA